MTPTQFQIPLSKFVSKFLESPEGKAGGSPAVLASRPTLPGANFVASELLTGKGIVSDEDGTPIHGKSIEEIATQIAAAVDWARTRLTPETAEAIIEKSNDLGDHRRDMFAAAAMQAMIACASDLNHAIAAKQAVRYADALIAELAK